MAQIPKIIHYCWFGGGSEGELIEACKETWSRYLPEYEIVRWDESNANLDLPFLRDWHQQKKWAFVADYVRLRALYEHGGIYLDTDIEVVRPLDNLLNHEAFIGEEQKGRCATGVIGSVKGNIFFERCMTEMESQWRAKKTYMIGPEVITKILNSSVHNVEIMPPEIFYPYNPYDSTRKVSVFMYRDVLPETYTVHHWNKSWNFSFFEKLRRKLKL